MYWCLLKTTTTPQIQTWAHLFFVRKSTVFWWLTFGTNAKVGEVTNQWHRQQYNGKRKGVSPSVRAMQPAYCCYSNTVHARSRPQKGNLARPRAKLLMPIQGKNQILVESWKTTFHQRSLENQFSLESLKDVCCEIILIYWVSPPLLIFFHGQQNSLKLKQR